MVNNTQKIISWFSCGVTSAVATKLAIDKYGIENVLIYYFKINQVHADNDRFIKECEQLYGKEIIQVQGKYKTPIEVASKTKYINGAYGARCTLELKKELRFKIEKEIEYSHQIFGFEYSPKEINRAKSFEIEYPNARPLFPLIENKINKKNAMYLLESVYGIKRPEMYNLGYGNNNCIGCFKGGKGYWNKIRIDFPEIFKETSKLERKIGRSCIKDCFLDELPLDVGRKQKIITPDCGVFCDIEAKF